MLQDSYDLAVIGGGLSGTAVARDAAGRGLSVFLAEAHDLAEGASSATGGLLSRPLDYLRPLALGALKADAGEADGLHHAAPHLIQPVTMLLPSPARVWPRLTSRVGLAAIDRARRGTEFPATRRLDLGSGEARGPISGQFHDAYAISDCVADDSRLVVLTAVDARNRGATISPRVRVVVAERVGERWRLSLEGRDGSARFAIETRVLVNATGAAVGDVNDHVIHTDRRFALAFADRAFIVVRCDLPEGVGYALPLGAAGVVTVSRIADGHALVGPRVVRRHAGDAAALTAADVRPILDAANPYLETPLAEGDVVSGLVSPFRETRRGREVIVDAPNRAAPVISIVGTTLTSHRRVAEAVVSAAGAFLKVGPAWTGEARLPGGGFPPGGVAEIARVLAAAYRFVPPATALRLARAYGTRAQEILTGTRAPADLGRCFGADLFEVEVHYLRREEWAETAADILWRRSKLGFQFSEASATALDLYLKRTGVAAPGPVIP